MIWEGKRRLRSQQAEIRLSLVVSLFLSSSRCLARSSDHGLEGVSIKRGRWSRHLVVPAESFVVGAKKRPRLDIIAASAAATAMFVGRLPGLLRCLFVSSSARLKLRMLMKRFGRCHLHSAALRPAAVAVVEFSFGRIFSASLTTQRQNPRIEV